MSSKNGILNLLTYVGEDNVSVQFLRQAVTNVAQRRDHTAVTFATAKGNIDPADLLPGHHGNKVGLVLWLDADVVAAWKETL